MLENFAHPNVDGVVYLQDYEDRSGTCPMNSDFWENLQQDTYQPLYSTEFLSTTGEVIKTKRRTQSLAQMMIALEQRDEDNYQERDYNSVLHSQTALLTHLNDGKSQDLKNLEQEKETQFRHIQNLEQEKETQKAIIEEQNERLRKYKIDDKYLKKAVG
ncbi:unnamed protein product [Mytilus edulis]|uniref:Uncharacterized protein n=1 Tax=Mytilus edulis TaxID=6550 RepID=A0A8S3RQP8_MYTED|nr:unnamed protein product [Mytilus edulis]